MNSNITSALPVNSTIPRAARILLALALLAPALFCGLANLLLPTLATFNLSLQKASLTAADQFVGLDNYAALAQSPLFGSASSFTLALIVTRLMAVALAPIVLALAAQQLGTPARIGLRLAFTVPLALFAPVSLALRWRLALLPNTGWLAPLLGPGSPLNLGSSAAGVVLLIDGLQTLALACGIGLVVFLPALRAVQARAALVVCWLIGLLAAAAYALQEFVGSYVLTNGRPTNTTLTFALYQYNQAFRFLQFGVAATLASLTLIALAILGITAGVLVAATGLQIGFGSESSGTRPASRAPGVVWLWLLAALGGLGLCTVSLVPQWGALNASAALPPGFALERLLPNTLVPVLAALAVQIPVAYAGALAIGALRPLGRHSEWLLLLFSPWLFVTSGPLSLAAFQGLRSAGTFNSVAALGSPLLISVPALFVFTLFFKGQARQWQRARAAGQGALAAFAMQMLLPSLPLVIGAAAVLALAGVQELLWPLVAASDPKLSTVNVALVQLASSFSLSSPTLEAAINAFALPVFLAFFVVFAALQGFYLERLVINRSTEMDPAAAQ
ncbi:MAG: sugar ABC transporter permease [Chloroflexi bacterium]|nr:sugar ABC transporter permease [Chloroflexota bacterium]